VAGGGGDAEPDRHERQVRLGSEEEEWGVISGGRGEGKNDERAGRGRGACSSFSFFPIGRSAGEAEGGRDAEAPSGDGTHS
jgi:hypothetical protein